MAANTNSAPRNPAAYVRRVAKFGLVGVTGLFINTGLLAVFTGAIGVHYLLGAVLATQGSTAWNFVITDWWVFRDRAPGRAAWHRFGMFWAMNNGALLVRGPLLWLFTSVFGIHYLVSNLITLVLVMAARYLASEFWIWQDYDTETVSEVGV